MFRRSLLLFVLMLPFCASAQGSSGFYSRAAIPIWEKIAGSPNPMVIPSPDSSSRVIATYHESGGADDDQHVTLNVEGTLGSLQLDIGPGVGSELLWSPDSKAFFVTSSYAGANGDYHLFIVDTFAGKLQSRLLSELIYRAFGHPFRCDPENRFFESPNVAGILWLGKTHHLWVAAEVVNHSVCDGNGTFRAYEVDPSSMTVLRTLKQLEAKQELGAMLGPELKHAPDECIRNPRSCYVMFNHPELEKTAPN